MVISNGRVSTYGDGPFSQKTELDCVKQLKNSFPGLPVGFYDVLSDRLRATGFTNQRLIDAINNVIDTCVYPIPTIASILSWDKSLKLYEYKDLLDLLQTDENTWSRFFQLKIEGKFYYALKKEADQFGIAYPKSNG